MPFRALMSVPPGRTTTSPRASISKSRRSPDFTRRNSRIFFGIVTWPLLVIVVVGIAASFLTVRKDIIPGVFVELASAQGERRESLKTVEARACVSQPFILVEPAGAPVASVILFTGGEGVLGFKGGPPFPRGNNFLVRNRQAFAAQGLLVAVVDAPSDNAGGLGRFRITEAHARDVAAVIAALRQTAAVPVWLVGTSRGTVSAVNAAARLEDNGADGLVITSSIMRGSRANIETIYDAGLESVRIPTLVVHNENDACNATPAMDASAIIGRVHAARKELRLFRGGAGSSGREACGPFAAHGYFGIDDEVVKAIADWIKSTPTR
jgi:hypothetical protein